MGADISTTYPVGYRPSVLENYQMDDDHIDMYGIMMDGDEGSMIFRTYSNGKHHLDFTDARELIQYLMRMQIPKPLRFFVRHNYRYIKPTVDEGRLILAVEKAVRGVVKARRQQGNKFIRYSVDGPE